MFVLKKSEAPYIKYEMRSDTLVIDGHELTKDELVTFRYQVKQLLFDIEYVERMARKDEVKLHPVS
jgi:hypothetical protein